MGKGGIYPASSTRALRSVLVLCSVVALIFFVRNLQPLLFSRVERVEEIQDASEDRPSHVAVNSALLAKGPTKQTTKDATELNVPSYQTKRSAVVPPRVSSISNNGTIESQTELQSKPLINSESAPSYDENQNNSTPSVDFSDEDEQDLSDKGLKNNGSATNDAPNDHVDSSDSTANVTEGKSHDDPGPEEIGNNSEPEAAEGKNEEEPGADTEGNDDDS